MCVMQSNFDATLKRLDGDFATHVVLLLQGQIWYFNSMSNDL
jgi:hypothetical protein